MSAPRVLLSGVVAAQPAGGVRRHLAELLPRVAALLAEDGGELAVLEGRDGLPFEPGSATRRLPSRVPPWPVARRALAEGRALRRALDEAERAGEPFALVHTGHLPAPRRLGLPLGLTVHDLRALDLPATPLHRRLSAPLLLRFALRRARVVVTVSEAVRAALLERFSLPAERVAVVGNGADHLGVLPRAPASRIELLHVGHVEPRKNLACAVRALALDPSLGVLRLAGRTPGRTPRREAERLAALARSLGVEDRIEWLGPVPDARLPELYASAHALVLPSRVEGFGLPLVEAQRAGLPVAHADVPALREVAGGAGFAFDPGDPAACARAVRAALAASPGEVAAGRANAERHGWDACAGRWVRAWRAAADASSA